MFHAIVGLNLCTFGYFSLLYKVVHCRRRW